ADSEAERLEQELERAEINVVTRRVDALDGLRAELKHFGPDIVISSYSLKDFNAFDVLAVLGVQEVIVPLIVVGDAIGEEAAAGCIKRGAVDFILKANLRRLASAVLNAIQASPSVRNDASDHGHLRHQEDLYRLIVENTYDVTSILDDQG